MVYTWDGLTVVTAEGQGWLALGSGFRVGKRYLGREERGAAAIRVVEDHEFAVHLGNRVLLR